MCHSVDVTLFRLNLVPGQSIFSQVVFAAKRALISGEYLPGQAFPSVRALAAELKIHPNTAHKVVQYLIQERLLESRPGVGTVVAEMPEARKGDRKRLLKDEVQRLVVEAKRVGLELDELQDAVQAQWAELERSPQRGGEVIRR
jgi:GntR family transcriptional regulator